jgi:putative DNA primase/helicase
VLIQVQRPQLLNGIEEIACRSDLLDRSLIVDLPAIPEERRRCEAEFWHDFEQAHPKILGALLDVLVVALRNYGALKVERPSRMADFERWVIAAEPAMLCEKWKEGDFRRAYKKNRWNAGAISMEVVPWVVALEQVLRHHRGNWKGTATDLLTAVNSRADAERFAANWPKTGRSLANAIRRLVPNLRAINIHVEFRRDKNRLIYIRAGSLPPIEGDRAEGSLF